MKLNKKTVSMFAAAVVMSMQGVAAFAEDIGYVLAGPDIYYRTGEKVFSQLAEAKGHKIIVANSEYSPSKELANVEDFIARGVDAIVLVSANAEAGTQAARRAKEAGVPIFFLSAMPQEDGYDVPTGMVSGNWPVVGYTAGEYVGTNFPGKSIAMVEGVYGQGITELIRAGFEQGIADTKGGNEIVMAASGNWNRQDGLTVVQDFIASQNQIDIIYALNEEMMAGTIQALTEAGQLDEKILISGNGKEIGWQWMRDGVMTATVANAPTMEADFAFQMVQAYFDGKEFPRHVINHQPLLTVDNLDIATPWDVENYFAKKESGKLVVDMYAEPLVTKESVY